MNYSSISEGGLFSGGAQSGSEIAGSAGGLSAEDIFSELDADGDGSISETEFQTAFEETKGLLDTLSASSQMKAFSLQNADYSGMASAVISDRDSDGDGSLSLSETDMTEERFSTVDTDGDGVLSAEEIAEDIESQQVAAQTAPPPPPPPSGGGGGGGSDDEEDDSTSSISEYDLNKDGVVTTEELIQALFGTASSEESGETVNKIMDNLFEDSSESNESQLTQQSSQVEEMRMQMNGNMSVMSQLLATQSAA
jgi:Ca2+-binding EF-hand superfamily protein